MRLILRASSEYQCTFYGTGSWYLLATSSLAWHVATPAPLTADTVYQPASFLFALWIRRQILPVLSWSKLKNEGVLCLSALREEERNQSQFTC